MKKTLTIVALMLVASAAAFAQSKVYLTREIFSTSFPAVFAPSTNLSANMSLFKP